MDGTKNDPLKKGYRPHHKLPGPEMLNGRLFSAQPLQPQEIARIEAHFSTLLSKRVVLKHTVDSGLIAGIKVEVGGSTWDGSARGALFEVRGHLEA